MVWVGQGKGQGGKVSGGGSGKGKGKGKLEGEGERKLRVIQEALDAIHIPQGQLVDVPLCCCRGITGMPSRGM